MCKGLRKTNWNMNHHTALLLLAICAAPALAQSQPAAPASPAFEVATVEPSNPLAARSGKRGITADPGRLSARRVSLKELILEAYAVYYYRISGGPSWLDSEEYDIDAKTETPADRDQMRLMLRTLRTTEALRDLLAGVLDMNTTRMRTHPSMDLEETLDLVHDAVKTPRLMTARRLFGVAVHRIALPHHAMTGPHHGIDDRRQRVADRAVAHPCHECHTAVYTVGIEPPHELDGLIGRDGRTDLDTDRVSDQCSQCHVGAIELARAVPDP